MNNNYNYIISWVAPIGNRLIGGIYYGTRNQNHQGGKYD